MSNQHISHGGIKGFASKKSEMDLSLRLSHIATAMLPRFRDKSISDFLACGLTDIMKHPLNRRRAFDEDTERIAALAAYSCGAALRIVGPRKRTVRCALHGYI